MTKCNIRTNYEYDAVKTKIREGDVLLFRGQGWISHFIGTSTETPYTHVGVASWINGNANKQEGILECVEFREGSMLSGLFGWAGAGGGRSVNLYQAVKKHPGCIDVYRPDPVFHEYHWDLIKKEFLLSQKDFDGKAVTRIMRRMTGLPYGWRRIWWIFKHKLLTYRIFRNTSDLVCDELDEIIYPVCSTAVAYAFTVNGFDLVNNRSDEWTEPGDLAKSAHLNYLGTLVL